MKKFLLSCIAAIAALASYASDTTCETLQIETSNLGVVLESAVAQYEGTGSDVRVTIGKSYELSNFTLVCVEEIPNTLSESSKMEAPKGKWHYAGRTTPFGLYDLGCNLATLLFENTSYIFYLKYVGSGTFDVYYREA